MKSKIVMFLLFTIIFNTTFAYGDTVEEESHINREIVYNSDIGEYEIHLTSDKSPRVGAVLTTSVATALLSLATKVGVEFASSVAMDKFLYDFMGMEEAPGIIESLTDLTKNSVSGVLNFGRSLVDSITSAYSKMLVKNVSYLDFNGTKVPVVGTAPKGYQTYTSGYTIDGKTLKKIVYDAPMSQSAIYTVGEACEKTISLGNNSIRVYAKEGDDSVYNVYKPASGSEYTAKGLSFSTYKMMKATPVALYNPSMGKHLLTMAYISWVPGSLYTQIGDGFCWNIGSSLYVENVTGLTYTSSVTTIPSNWENEIKDKDGTTQGDVAIGLPSDSNDLIGKLPSDITDTPSYDVWTPGVDIVPPAVDTPSVPIVPDSSIDIPDTDIPGTDTPSLSWDWLKELLNRLLELIQTIIDWLTSFWDNLLEFLKSLLVPGEGYFVEEFGKVTEKLEEKIPSIDISKLEDLAVGEAQFKDMYAEFFGIRCLVVRGSVINSVIGWIRPIIQGLVALFLLLWNYNQIYFLIRGTSLMGASNSIDNMNNGRIGGRR